MFGKIGNFAVKQRVWIIMGWVLAALLMFFLAPSLSKVGTMTEANFLPRDSESLRARELISEYFPQNQAASTVSLVFYNGNKLGESDLAYAKQVSDWLSSGSAPFKVENVTSIFMNPELESRLVSPDQTTMLMNAGLSKVAFESDSINTTKDIRDYLQTAPPGLEIYVSGQVGIYSDLFASVNQSITLTTIITIVLVVLLLIIIFRSPVAALVPLITIVMAFAVARGLMGLIGQAGVSIWSQIELFLIVMIFGIGTDYCLFMVSRFREELKRQTDRKTALSFAVSKIGVVIGASAFAVIVGLAGMAVARYQMIQTMGPLLGVAIFVTLLAALTLAPALASMFGQKLFWPRHENKEEVSKTRRPGFWTRVANISTGKPAIVAIVVVIIMLIPYLALPNLNRSFDQLAEIPANSESVKGFKILQQHYDIGEMDPLTAIIVAPDGQTITGPAALEALDKINHDLRSTNGVVKVQSIIQPDGTEETPQGLTVSGQLSAITEEISASFSNSSTDPSMLFSDKVSSGFNQMKGYLGELEQNFAWVKDDTSFKGVNSNLQSLQKTILEIQSAAMVENQLKSISSQIQQMGQSLSTPGATFPPQSAQSVTLVKSYLEELAGKYPAVKSEASYQSVYNILSNMQTQLGQIVSLPPEQQQAMMSSLPQYIQQISAGLETLSRTFSGTNSVLFSNVLSQASQGPSPMDALKSQFAEFNINLQSLSQKFAQNGNPAFLSSTLMTSSDQAKGLMSLFFSENNQATKMYIVLNSYPQSDGALSAVGDTRKAIQSSIDGTVLKGSEVVIGGTSAELADVRQILDQDFTRVMIVVLVAIFIVLGLLLRSLIAPLYLLLTVLLSYGTTLGIVSWIFQGILGQEGISFLIPIIVFVLLVALGSDYNIFLMSRVKEESQNQPTRRGARLAAIATGGVITACGIILAGTFGALVVTPIRTLMQIGAAVAIGVLIDTFIVRALLVPAIASMLGRWNWWPSRHG